MMKYLSPLNYAALENLSKEELIQLCRNLSDRLLEVELNKIKIGQKRGQGKTKSHIDNVVGKVYIVFLDLTRKLSNDPAKQVLPNGPQMETELNRRFGEIEWVFNIPPIRAEKGQKGFYRIYLSVKKHYCNFLRKGDYSSLS